MGCLAMAAGRRRESISHVFDSTKRNEMLLSIAAVDSRWTRFCFKLAQDYFVLETRILEQ